MFYMYMLLLVNVEFLTLSSCHSNRTVQLTPLTSLKIRTVDIILIVHLTILHPG